MSVLTVSLNFEYHTGVCPLDDYLFALSYLSRLGPALEGYRREHRGLGTHPVIQFRQLVSTAESVRLSVMGAAPPNLKHEPFVVNMNIFLDEETMKLKLKLDFGMLHKVGFGIQHNRVVSGRLW